VSARAKRGISDRQSHRSLAALGMTSQQTIRSFDRRMPRRPTRPPPLLADFDDEERDAVLAANRAFYRAFNDRDYQAMEGIWAPTGAMVCLHPGQPPLHERADILA